MQICSNFISIKHLTMQAKILIIALLVNIYTATAFPQDVLQNREPFAAGRFYTDKPAELKAQLQQLFSGSIKMKSENTPLAIIVPHAGYIYSGEVAASAYNQIDPNRKFERIFIIGSSHTMAFTGASVFCSGNYETPFGTVEVDTDLAKQLVAENKILKDYPEAVSYTHLRAHETRHDLVCRLLLE